MAFVNNAMIIRRELLKHLSAQYKENRISKDIDRIPLEISKLVTQSSDRCCIHKIRAVAKYKLMGLLGFGTEEETDELMSLSEYLDMHLDENFEPARTLTVVDEACTSCVKANYIVTNLCKGCIARPCEFNCPKGSIFRNNQGQAEIDPKKCVSCGICKEVCPYHSIIYMPVPCEESCPVGAIRKDENGKEKIDENKCILCGKCVNACPFGSIMETTQLMHILTNLSKGEKLIAMVAPSISGQFSCSEGNIAGALKTLGFDKVVNVAAGATQTTQNESDELKQFLAEGHPFMTSSCCPSWVMAAKKHLPEIKPFISHTPSPMVYTAEMCKEKWPNHKTVFIGPCIAKRNEGMNDPNVDFVLTFEELGSWFSGWNISPEKITPGEFDIDGEIDSKRYAMSGGVSNAIKGVYPEAQTFLVDGLDKKNLRLMKGYLIKKQAPARFLEVMSCQGGCIAGPSSLCFTKEGIKNFTAKYSTEE